MPSICVELATLHLQSGLAGGIDQDADYLSQIKLALEQPGLRVLRTGTAIEAPNDMYWLVEWGALEDHHTLQAKPIYGPFAQYLGSITAGTPPVELHHFQVGEAALHATLAKPATEIFTFRLPEGDLEAFTAEWSAFGEQLRERAGAVPLVARSIEDDRQFNVLIGWDSVEAHAEAKKNDWLAEGLKKFSPKWTEPKLVHVNFGRK